MREAHSVQPVGGERAARTSRRFQLKEDENPKRSMGERKKRAALLEEENPSRMTVQIESRPRMWDLADEQASVKNKVEEIHERTGMVELLD
jgi:hypothetical protein